MKKLAKKLATGSLIGLFVLLTNINAEATKLTSSNYNAIETTLQTENRMTDDSLWNMDSYNIPEFVTETENSMEIESWMTSEIAWNSTVAMAESDTSLELEDWMISDEVWNVVNEIAVDEELVVEGWMINNKNWE